MGYNKLDWNKLLNDRRRKPRSVAKAKKTGEHRVELERDYDRILFSTPVRRLADKTQVFPLDPNDSVRTRLTHSHEVANLARSIGTSLMYDYADKLQIPTQLQPQRAVPSLLGAIGLAHDLGNPPFGHQGEEAVRSWMKQRASSDAKFWVCEGQEIIKAQQNDFLHFEGNAQSFRLLTCLQIIDDEYGLNMSYAFLAALMKYPVPSHRTVNNIHSRKKFNFFQSEAPIVEEVWRETGLRMGVRHPLTCIMEACDDIAYSVLDIEDAAKKGLISVYDLVAWLKHDFNENDLIKSVCEKADENDRNYRQLPLSFAELCDISMQMFRVHAIGAMVTAVIRAYIKHSDEIMSGEFDGELLYLSDGSALAKSLKKFAKKNVYNHRSVLEVERIGHRTLHALMSLFWQAITDRYDLNDIDSQRQSPFSNYVYSRISENYRRAAQSSKMPMRYRELQLITDMISGMTDSYAINLLRDLENFRG